MRRFFSLLFLGLSAAGVQAAPVFVDGEWLAARLNDPKLVVVDMSDEDVQYRRFHLPGAVRLPYAALVKPRKSDKVPVRLEDAELAALLGRLGIARDAHVVVYDDMGGLNAARLYWELERIGHPAVSVLDGGLVAWVLEGRKVVNNAPVRVSVQYALGNPGRANEATLAEVRAAAAANGAPRLLDVRSAEEYLGSPKEKRSGHVPGARWWPWEQGVDFERGFRRRADDRLRDALRQSGVADAQAPVIAYCRSGHRAARAYLALRALGFENVKLYAPSMNEYARAADAPLALGAAP